MKLMVIDGNSIINRAFYGIRMLTTRDGTPTNAVYGFSPSCKSWWMRRGPTPCA
jgi:5'-3' exonuclease